MGRAVRHTPTPRMNMDRTSLVNKRDARAAAAAALGLEIVDAQPLAGGNVAELVERLRLGWAQRRVQSRDTMEGDVTKIGTLAGDGGRRAACVSEHRARKRGVDPNQLRPIHEHHGGRWCRHLSARKSS